MLDHITSLLAHSGVHPPRSGRPKEDCLQREAGANGWVALCCCTTPPPRFSHALGPPPHPTLPHPMGPHATQLPPQCCVSWCCRWEAGHCRAHKRSPCEGVPERGRLSHVQFCAQRERKERERIVIFNYAIPAACTLQISQSLLPAPLNLQGATCSLPRLTTWLPGIGV